MARHRRTAVFIALAIAAIVALVVLPTSTEQAPQRPTAGGWPPEGWTRLPDPPEIRAESSAVWTGSELLLWGGCPGGEIDGGRCPSREGFSFDPSRREWEPIPAPPADGAGSEVVWTGEEAIFLNVPLEADGPMRGEAYQPNSRTWRTVRPAPIPARDQAVVVWTGSEIIVWGGGNTHDQGRSDGAAYKPESDTWRRIADAPVALNLASGAWTGEQLLVFGSGLDGRNRATTKTAVGAAFDPIRNSWRKLPASRLSPQATSAVWTGDRLVAWDYLVHSQNYDPGPRLWSPKQRMPLDFSECYPESASAGSFVLAFFCGPSALYDPDTGDWERVRGGPFKRRTVKADGGKINAYGSARLSSLDDAVLLQVERPLRGPECYGCKQRSEIWAFKPSGQAEALRANVFLSVFCRHPDSTACDRVVLDVQGLKHPATAMRASIFGRSVVLRPLDRRERVSGRVWRGSVPNAGLQGPPIEFDPHALDTPVSRPPVPVAISARYADGSTAETTARPWITLPDLGTEYDSRRDDYHVRLPLGWRRAEGPLTPSLLHPDEIFSAGTFRLRKGGTCLPARALREMAATDALVSIQERSTEEGISVAEARRKGFPPRPDRFAPTPRDSGCLTVPGIDTSFIPFRDSGRLFYAILALGEAAPAELEREALAILDNIEFDRRGPS